MLQHDPNAWRAKILPECNAQLTLSGHTHGGQFSLFGWNPANFTYSECFGMYYEGDRAIYVSSGLGGIIPFRLGQPGEIVVITLRKK
jgi:predicted MPP superfamily phosphohydrolase